MSRADMPDRLAIPRDAKPRDMGAHQTRRVSAGKANRLAAPRTFGKRRDVRLAKIDRAIGQESHRIEPAGKIIVPRLDYGNRIGRVGRGIDGGHENRNRRRSGISNALERTGSDCRPLPGGEQKRAKAVTCSGAGNIELLLVHRAVGRDGDVRQPPPRADFGALHGSGQGDTKTSSGRFRSRKSGVPTLTEAPASTRISARIRSRSCPSRPARSTVTSLSICWSGSPLRRIDSPRRMTIRM